MVQAFGKKSQSLVLFGVHDTKSRLWNKDLYTEQQYFHNSLDAQFFICRGSGLILFSLLLWKVCHFAANLTVFLSGVCLTANLTTIICIILLCVNRNSVNKNCLFIVFCVYAQDRQSACRICLLALCLMSKLNCPSFSIHVSTIQLGSLKL